MVKEKSEWKRLFSQIGSKILRPSRERDLSLNQSSEYLLSLDTIDGLLPKLKDINLKPHTQLRVSLYDEMYKKFIGITWKSEFKVFKSKYAEKVYLKTSLSDALIIIVIELVAKLSDDGSLLSCGWCILRPFVDNDNDLNDDNNKQRVSWLSGTPRSLLFMDDSTKLTQITGCYLNYSFDKIKLNDFCKAQLAENVFTSELNENANKSCGLIDQLFISLNPNISSFESNLCASIAQDYYLWDNGTQIDANGIVIHERRMKIGVHNGVTYLCDPIEIQLSMENQSGTQRIGSTRRNRPNSKTHASSSLSSRTDLRVEQESTRLEMRNSCVLNNLNDSPTCCVLFILEYVLNVPISLSVLNKEKGKNVFSNKTQYKTHHVTVRWSSWTPGNYSRLSDELIDIDCVSDDQHFCCPDGTLVFKSFTSQIDTKISFRFKFGQTLPSMDIPRLEHVEIDENKQVTSSIRQTQSDSRLQSASKRIDNTMRQVKSHTQMLPSALQGSLELYPMQVSSVPVLALEPGQIGGRTITRAAYAKLHSSKFPPIIDRYGKLAEVIDEQSHIEFNLQREEQDPLSSSEIIFQFLAFSKLINSDTQLQNLLFTFQFYRFPQTRTPRLQLDTLIQDYSMHPNSIPFVLKHANKPGFMCKFKVDPGMLKFNEKKIFLQYLAHQTIFVDVWDGDSLHLIGTCTLQLKELLRHGREAVQAIHELDVLSTEYDDAHTLSGSTLREGIPYTTNSHIKLKGRLHLRVGNIGYPCDNIDGSVNDELHEISSSSKPLPISRIIASRHATLVPASKSTREGLGIGGYNLSKANHMTETFKDIHAALVTKSQTRSDTDPQRRRKLNRMELARRLDESKELSDDMKLSPMIVNNHRRQIEERDRDLKIIEYYRTQTKRNQIMSKLNQYITTEYTLVSSFGTVEFFEYTLENPAAHEQIVVIVINSDELQVISDAKEWSRHRQLNQMYTEICEENMFNYEVVDSSSGLRCPTVLLKPNESIRIPFKYQSFQVATSTSSCQKIQVDFKQQSDGTPLSILLLTLEHQPHIVTQTFHFNQAENSFFKRTIRLPSSIQALPSNTNCVLMDTGINRLTGTHDNGLTQVFVRSSDSSVLCESRAVTLGEPHDVFMKVSCGLAPLVKQFQVAIYADRHLIVPLQIWHINIHCLKRIDLSTIQGQTSRFSLLLKGKQASRLVRMYASVPEEMSVNPQEKFMLESNAMQEVNIGIRSLKDGHKNYYLNVVDLERNELVNTWFIQVNCKPPVISKAFELKLPAYSYGQTTNYHLKRITYKNPYASDNRLFHVHTNRSDLLVFKESSLRFAPFETKTLSLKFLPNYQAEFVEILVFINNENDINEETFSLRVTYAFE